MTFFLKNKLTVLILAVFALLAVQIGCRREEPAPELEAVLPFSGVDSAQIELVLADLSLEEKIGQLIVWEASAPDSLQKMEAMQRAAGGTIGGLLLNDLPLTDYMYLTDSMERSAKLPLLFGTREKVSLHNQFSNLPRFPLPVSVASVDSTELQRLLERHYLRQCKAIGLNFSLSPDLGIRDPEETDFDFQTFENDEPALIERAQRMTKGLNDHRILALGARFSKFEFAESDSIRDSLLHRFQMFTRVGLPGLLVDDQIFRDDSLQLAPPYFVKNYLEKYLNFNGLMVVQLQPGESPEQKLLEGADLVITPDAARTHELISKLAATNALPLRELNRRVRLVLRAKAWVNGGRLPVGMTIFPVDSAQQQVRLVSLSERRSPTVYSPPSPMAPDFNNWVEEILCYFEDPGWGNLIGSLFENSVILARNERQELPFKNIYDTDFQLLEYANKSFRVFENTFVKYADFKKTEYKPLPSGELNPIDLKPANNALAVIILLDSLELRPDFHRAFISSVNSLAKETEVSLVNFGNPKNLSFFSKEVNSIQIFERNNWTEAYAAQLLFGGVPAVGKLPLSLGEELPFGAGDHTPAQRLAFNNPEKVGIAPERLVGIDAIALTAIDKGVFPGCQVLVAKEGRVVYSKGFGQHTYGKNKQQVRTADLYDIASVTKVAATTPAIMKLVESGKVSLRGELGDYLPLDDEAEIRNLSLRELLLHNSGLQAQMPLKALFSNRSVPTKGCNDIFCRVSRGAYNIKVANGLYLRRDYLDTIQNRVFHLSVQDKKKYRYSDVNFYLLQKVVEAQSKTSLDKYVFENFYRPLGLRHVLYKPIEKYGLNAIAPTEKDIRWRSTLVHGYVHDPSAALLGGVAGNAGLFANAEDLAALFQMLLNGGAYGGVQYFEPETVHDFTVAKNANYRGLGFDKPASPRYPTYSRHASTNSYGHTGFTGDCVWVDPDEDLVYIFLSNRINPSARNGKIFTEDTRRRIHEVIYDALDSYEMKLPELAVQDVAQ